MIETKELGVGEPRRGRRRFAWIVVIVLLALAVLAIRVEHFHGSGLMPDMMLDDAYISFRYARNLARGEGLVYNVGERVEGYTNFLWTVATAAAMAGGFEPEPAAETMAALAALGTILLLAALARRTIRGPGALAAWLLPPLLYAAIDSQARHVVSGMETLLFVFLVLAAFACLELVRGPRDSTARTALAAGALFGLATLTRPEGALYAGIGLLCFSWDVWRGSSEDEETRAVPRRVSVLRRLRSPLLMGLAFLAFVVPHLAWRWSYYGFPLPNTYYAKVSGPVAGRLERGWATLERGLEDWAIWPLLWIALLALPAIRRDRFWAWCFAITAATWASFVLVGGDFVHSFGPRMLMPALPFVLLAAAEGLRSTFAALTRLSKLPTRFRPTVLSALIAVIVIALAGHALRQPWPTRPGRLGGLATVHHAWRATGEWLAEEAPSGALIATSAAGILPFVSDRPVLDMFGLTDAYIAHHSEIDPRMPPAHGKSDPQYVMRRRPDYIHVVFVTAEGIPSTAGLGWVWDQMSEDYEIVAQAMSRRGPRVRGQWVIETDRFRPGLHSKGYESAVYRRRDLRTSSDPR